MVRLTCGHTTANEGTDVSGRAWCEDCHTLRLTVNPKANPQHDDAVTRYLRRMDDDRRTKGLPVLTRGDAEPPRLTIDPEVTPLDESLIDLQRLLASTVSHAQLLARRVEALQAENARLRTVRSPLTPTCEHIAAVLRAFLDAPLSISSLQPILTLARELNPEAK